MPLPLDLLLAPPFAIRAGMPGLAAYYDFTNSSQMTVDASNRVSQVNDLSGYARHLLQATGSAQPLLLPWSGTNYLYCPSVSGNYASTPSAAPVQITGNFDAHCLVAMPSWSSLTACAFLSRYVTTNGRSYEFGMDTTGHLVLQWTPDTDAHILAAVSTVATGFAAYSAGWIRAALTVNNGSAQNEVRFYTSTDGVTWTQLGTTVTQAGTTSIAAGSDALSIGSRGSSASLFAGSYYRAKIYNGIAATNATPSGTGTLAFDANFTQVPNNATSFTESSANGATVTVNSTGSKPAQVVGKQSVLFDGSAYYLKTAAFTLNQPETVVLMGKQNTWVANTSLFDGNSADTMAMATKVASPQVQIYAGSLSSSLTTWSIGANSVVQAVFNNASSFIRLNRGTAVTGTIGAANAGGFTIGSNANGINLSALQVTRVLIFSAALDTATLDRIAVWAGKQDGITV